MAAIDSDRVATIDSDEEAVAVDSDRVVAIDSDLVEVILSDRAMAMDSNWHHFQRRRVPASIEFIQKR